MKAIFFFLKRMYAFAGHVFLLNFIGMLFIGLLESMVVFLILPLLQIIGIYEMNVNEAVNLSWLIGAFQQIPKEQSLLIILAIYMLAVVGAGLFNRHQTIKNKKIEQGFVRQLREEAYKGLIQADWSFFLRNRKSDLVKMLTTEISTVKNGLNVCLQFSYSLIFAGVKIAVAFCLSPQMTMITLLFGWALLLCSRYFTRKSKQFGHENKELSREYLAGITDHLNGIKDMKSNSLEISRRSWISSLCQKVERNAIESTRLKTNSQFIFKTVQAFLLVLFVWFIAGSFQTQPTQLLLVLLIFSRIWPVVNQTQANLEKLAAMIPSFEALADFLKLCAKAREVMDEDVQAAGQPRFESGIELKNVYFQYHQDENRYALKNISLHIPVNRMTAFIGPSGAGKSTLIDIITGLNRPQRGSVLLDGVLLNHENIAAFRRMISYVPQDPFLFNGSIRENLLLMEPKATEEELWKALEMSSAKEFVEKLPCGLDTFIGDRGIRLSGGERQRLVFARAILRKPKILILDEATSALDYDTEMKIKETIDRLRGEMTIIAIAHRMSTIQHADNIIVLKQGEIVQSDRFLQLAAAGMNS